MVAVLALVTAALLGLLGWQLLLRRQAADSDLTRPNSGSSRTQDAAEPTEPPGVSVTAQDNPEND